jgi:hypothetical protein
MKTKRSWLVWFAPLVAAVPIALTNCGGSTAGVAGGSGLDGGGGGSGTTNGSGATSTSGATSGTLAGSGAGGSGTTANSGTATSGTTAGTGAGGTGASTGAGGTGASTGAGGTGASTGAGGTGASTGASTGATDPCTDGMFTCRMGQQCSETLGCVQCLTNANCPPAGALNAALKVCVLGSCEACGADTDCAANQVCEPATHTCRASCIVDGGANCTARAGAPICDTTTGACVGCLTATDCKDAARPVCDPTSQQCVQCGANADCAAEMTNKLCDTASATCVACLANTDCPAARPACNANTHMCQAGCTASAQCVTSTGGELPICDTANGRCVECTTAAQCPGMGAMCTANVCTGGMGGTGTCNSPADCSPDGGGATPYCTGPGGRCVQCLVAKDCPGTGRVVCAGNRCL